MKNIKNSLIYHPHNHPQIQFHFILGGGVCGGAGVVVDVVLLPFALRS